MPKLLLSALATLSLLHGSLAWSAEPGWFGLSVRVRVATFSLNPTLRTVTIEDVAPSSPAAGAGLASGDVVLQIQGIAIAGTKANVLRNAMQKSVGEPLQVRFQHGSEAPRDVVLIAAPKPLDR
jgi:C-terminal processing protease CtpA/Prc